MKDKEYKTVEDLLTDPTFCQWVNENASSREAFWKAWVAASPTNERLFRQAQLILEGLPFDFKGQGPPDSLIQAEWELLKRKLPSEKAAPSPLTAQPARRPFRRIVVRGLAVAASVLMVISVGYFLWEWAFNPMVEYQTHFGQQLTLVLPDSTVLELNANSRLAYRERNPRKVWLDGEAYFEVKKKPATGANFQVITDDLTVEVLGTAFNVLERVNETEVILEEGSVKLNLQDDRNSELYMEPGEMVAFSAAGAGRPIEKRKINTKALTSWKDGELQFTDVPIAAVMQRIEEIYGWKAVYEDPALQNRKISTRLPPDDLESALLLLSKAIGIDIVRSEADNTLKLQ